MELFLHPLPVPLNLYVLLTCARFNELFSRSQFEAAAIYAANCPRGILHNEETMEKFRGMYVCMYVYELLITQ